MKQLISDHCIGCKYRGTCIRLCPEAERYVNQDYTPAREVVWSELTDKNIDQVELTSPWGDGYELTNTNWIILIKKLKLCRIFLTKNQKKYLYLYYIGGLSQTEIADKYSISQQMVSKTIAGAKIKLNKFRRL